MRFLDLKTKLQNIQPFSLNDIKKYDPDFYSSRFTEWQKKGYILKVTKGFYTFSDLVLSENTVFRIANEIYSPSYVSLESALNQYNIIPEGVYSITSVTTKETQILNSNLTTFSYKSIKNDLFWGYVVEGSQIEKHKIASLEKALLDYFYFNKNLKTMDDIQSLRLNYDILKSKLDIEIYQNYLQIFKNLRVQKLSKILLKVIINA